MKVLHVIAGIADRYGGPSTVVRSMCSALQRRPNVDVELATTNADGRYGELPTNRIPQDYPVHVFNRDFSENWKYSRDMGRWLTTHAKDYDIVHAHSLWSFSTWKSGQAAYSAEVPFVIRTAGTLAPYTFSRGQWKKFPYWQCFERHTVRRANCLHATSSGESREIQSVTSNSPVRVIPNGVESDAWKSARDASLLRQMCGEKAHDRDIVLFMGRLHPVKGIVDLLLPAFAKVKSDACLAIVGNVDQRTPNYGDAIREETRRLRLQNRVAVLSAISPSKKWAMYDGARCFVLPSRTENFGMVLVEAMARGCPVVTTDAVQANEHLRKAGAGIVVPREANSLATSIDDLLGSRELRLAYGSRGKAYAQSTFDWDAIARQVELMYSTVAGITPAIAS